MLPCGHTFCLQCIVRQIASSWKKTVLLCSLCRQTCALPNGGAGKLPKNYSLTAVLSETVKDTSCLSAADANFLCKTHTNQKIVVYCKDCEEYCCVVCSFASHSKHTCIGTRDADEEFKMAINEAAKKCEEAIATQRRQISKYERMLREENSKLEKNEEQLAHYETLVCNSALLFEREAAAKSLADSSVSSDEREAVPASSRGDRTSSYAHNTISIDHIPSYERKVVGTASYASKQFERPRK
jgi:ribosomal protein S27E